MIELQKKTGCCGCSACMNICPKKCITMEFDEEGFAYPVIDKSKCINCHLCEKVCPILNNQKSENRKPKAFGAFCKDENIRKNSSSGGIFSVLAKAVIEQNGVVFGAAFNDKFEVVHTKAETEEEIEKLRVSKYVQSEIGSTFAQAKKFLDEGRLVLFTGTPCQIEGLIKFLQKPYKNLITQDIICHGVPSPKVWEKYLVFREEKANSKIVQVQFRSKIKGWKNYSFRIVFESGQEYVKTPFHKDPMMKMFLHNKCLRPTCYECAFKKESRVSDITLADFWGIDKINKNANDNKGISLILVHSKAGEEFLEKIKPHLNIFEVDYDEAQKLSPMLKNSAKSFQRTSFMKDFQTKPFKKVVKKYGEGLY